MQYTATVTSKRQLTIPAPVYSALGLEKGRKVIITVENHVARIESALQLVEQLAGSITPPVRFVGVSPNRMVAQAKKEYFDSRRPRA